MGQVGIEPRLRDPDRIEPVEHAVERGGHAHEFGIGVRKVDPRGEVALRDAACGPGNAGQRHHHPRQDPPHRQGQRRHHQRDRPRVEPEHVPQRLLQLPQRSAHEQHRLVASPTACQPNVAVGRGPDGLHPIVPLRLPGETVGQSQRTDGCTILLPHAGKPWEPLSADRRRDEQSHRQRGLQVARRTDVGQKQPAQSKVGLEQRFGSESLLRLERAQSRPQLRVDVAEKNVLRHVKIDEPDRDRDGQQEHGHPKRRPPAEGSKQCVTHGHPAVR